MCSGTDFQRWQANAILELLKHGHQPVLLITDGRKPTVVPIVRRLMQKKWRTILFSILENRFFKPDAKMPVSLAVQLHDVERLECRPEQRGISEYFSGEEIAAIRSCRLDFILRFGFYIIRGEILEAARFGVWSFHHDDEMKYRGGPAGFWEIFHGDPVSGAILQRLTNRLDGGIILRKGYLQTVKHSFTGNLESLLMVSSAWPALVATQMEEPGGGGLREDGTPSRTTAPIYKIPANFTMIRFLFKLLVNRIDFYLHEFVLAEQWNVGLVNRTIDDIALTGVKLKDEEVTWAKSEGKSIYLADPFSIGIGDRLHILTERYDYRLMEGRIAVSTDPVRVGGTLTGSGTLSGWVTPSGSWPVGHLSYPFTFIYQGDSYCIPESAAAGKISLLKFDVRKNTFEKVRDLVENVNAADPTMVFFNDYWWLFFTERRYSNTHLLLYHSTEFSGEFLPHRMNPVKIDIRSARPAGTPFISGGRLYRPSQDCSVTYGGRVVINEVTEISQRVFAEKEVNVIAPPLGTWFDKGLHTISAAGGSTLIDGKRFAINRNYFISQVTSRFGKKGKQHG